MKRIVQIILAVFFFCLPVLQAEVTRQREAVRTLALRASRGDSAAMFELARLHDNGFDSIRQDSLRAIALYRMAAEKGYAPARNYLGFRYFTGQGVNQNPDSALYWINLAAGDGDVTAANNLGFIYASGNGVAQDYKKAFYWFSKAAEAGMPQAESQLADLYREGKGTDADTVKAVEFYERAISRGLGDADFKLRRIAGERWRSLPTDSLVVKGRHYYTHGAPFTGVALLEIASSGGSADAMALLADAYSRGAGAGYDHDKSVGLFLKAALRGNPSAAFIIGELLDIFPDALKDEDPMEEISVFYGANNVPSDIMSPDFWYARAAEKGVKDAEEASRLLLMPDISAQTVETCTPDR